MAQGDTNDIAGIDAKAHDAPSELVHDHEHSVAIQKNGFSLKQFNSLKAVLRVSQEG